MASGKLQVSASSNLGGLGAAQGPPVTFNWLVPAMAPLMVPWLAILLMLCLKPNRSLSVWWIWLPLGLLAAITYSVHLLDNGQFMFEVYEYCAEVLRTLAFGLAGLWLLSPFVLKRGWAARLTGIVVFQAVGVLVACPAVSGLDEMSALQKLLLFGMGVVFLSLCLTATGLLSRRRYGVFRLLARLAFSIVVLCELTGVLISICTSGLSDWAEAVTGCLVISGVVFGLFLPFLLLSFFNSGHGGRLKGLLNLTSPQPQASPPVPQPVPA
jgi:hypothetical protein